MRGIGKWSAAAVALVLTSTVAVVRSVEAGTDAVRSAAPVAVDVCLPDLSPESLDTMFDSEPAGVVGADYQRAFTMPDGRVLWTFQDAAVRIAADQITIVHNIAVIQDGACFTVRYNGTQSDPRPMFFADQTVPFERWFWPMDAALDDDGMVQVFLAEMVEQGESYLTHTVPVATTVATFDPSIDAVVAQGSPADSSADLYGWSITSDDEWTYLYAHCYRQFGFDEFALVFAFDRSCATDITVARAPVGQPLAPLEYWDGERWQGDPARVAPVIGRAGRRINANQFEWTGARFVSVNKEGDWWGDTIYLSQSTSPTGPFEIYDAFPAPAKCALDCNSFFATWIPAAAAGRSSNQFVIGLAHNRWDGVISSLYRPTYHDVAAPVFLPAGHTLSFEFDPTVTTAALNVAVVDARERGFLSVFPCAAGVPNASNVNHVNEPVASNLVLARPDDSGRVCVFSPSAVNVVIDAAGTFGPETGYVPESRPRRLVDTRVGTGAPSQRLTGGGVLRVDIPAQTAAVAVVLNIVAINPAEPGFVTAYRCDRERPGTSNVNYVSEPVVSNLVISPMGGDGSVCIFTLAETDIVVDIAGAFVETDGSPGFVASVDPRRLLDTRVSTSTDRPVAGEVVEIAMPTDDASAVLNLAAIGPAGPGHLTVFPCEAERPATSSVNFVDVGVVSNLVIAEPSDDGRVCVYASTSVDIVVDLIGALPSSSGYEPLDVPLRLVDSRDGTGIAGQLGIR